MMTTKQRRGASRKLGPAQRDALLYFLDHPEGWHPLRDVGRANDVQKAVNSLFPTFLERTTVDALRQSRSADNWIQDTHFRPDAPAFRLCQTPASAIPAIRQAAEAFRGTALWNQFVFTRAFQVYLQHVGTFHVSNLVGRFALGLRQKLDLSVMREYADGEWEAHLIARSTWEALRASGNMSQFWISWRGRLEAVGIRPFPAYLVLCFASWEHFIDLIYWFRTSPTSVSQSFGVDPLILRPLKAKVQFGDKPATDEPTHFVYAWCAARVHEWWRDDHLGDESLQERLRKLFPGGGKTEETITRRVVDGQSQVEHYMRWTILPAAKVARIEIDPATTAPRILLDDWARNRVANHGT